MRKTQSSLFITAFLFVLICSSCTKNVQQVVEVYHNNFESNDLTGIRNGMLDSFNNTQVLGMYNASGFDLVVNDLPQHDMVEITFDLYIHDSWDGNKLGIDSVDGPDIWQMKVDDELYINTTFSNAICPTTTFCPPQSYPSDYLNSNHNPRQGASKIDLPSVCHDTSSSTLYKIKKNIRHTGSKLTLQCMDQLVQLNTSDPQCDESWSVDNINIRIITLK